MLVLKVIWLEFFHKKEIEEMQGNVIAVVITVLENGDFEGTKMIHFSVCLPKYFAGLLWRAEHSWALPGVNVLGRAWEVDRGGTDDASTEQLQIQSPVGYIVFLILLGPWSAKRCFLPHCNQQPGVSKPPGVNRPSQADLPQKSARAWSIVCGWLSWVMLETQFVSLKSTARVSMFSAASLGVWHSAWAAAFLNTSSHPDSQRCLADVPVPKCRCPAARDILPRCSK